MSTAIKVEHLSKKYSIGHQAAKPPASLKELVEAKRRALRNRLLGHQNREDSASSTEVFYALNDISFEVNQGERLGVIGANGAGKSTLLKILSRITDPSGGRITIRGRVSSLLEVGTGFHPELTGRENVFLNGAILGMPRSEIRKRFDEIVAFSEVERFIDTPVKHYSSGMYVRLAFSVAAHMDPEVLILDEVLAVGDMKFQRKCLEQMRFASEEGRTVLFVSHSMQAVGQICSKAIYLEAGKIRKSGLVTDVLEDYISQSSTKPEKSPIVMSFQPQKPLGDEFAQLSFAEIVSDYPGDSSLISIDYTFRIRMHYRISKAEGHLFIPNFHIRNAEGVYVFVTSPANGLIQPLPVGEYMAECVVPSHLLNNGLFSIQLALSSFNLGQTVHFNAPDALSFEVIDDLSDVSFRNGYMLAIPGVFRPRLGWHIESTP